MGLLREVLLEDDGGLAVRVMGSHCRADNIAGGICVSALAMANQLAAEGSIGFFPGELSYEA